MMKRDECFKALARAHTNEIVVAVYQSGFDWRAIKPWPLNYFCTGVMGQASSHGLGLALGRPDKRVIVLDGDGSLLMQLGSLVTVASLAPANFFHVVFDNGVYESSGNQKVPGHGVFDFPALARAAGYRRAHDFTSANEFADRLPSVLSETGPVFVRLAIDVETATPRWPTMRMAEQVRNLRARLSG
jgi:sulfopyruvate decarboxylase subunit beta